MFMEHFVTEKWGEMNFSTIAGLAGFDHMVQGRAGDKRGKEVKELLSVVGQQSVTSEKKNKEKA